jgi:hypothetical protein
MPPRLSEPIPAPQEPLVAALAAVSIATKKKGIIIDDAVKSSILSQYDQDYSDDEYDDGDVHGQAAGSDRKQRKQRQAASAADLAGMSVALMHLDPLFHRRLSHSAIISSDPASFVNTNAQSIRDSEKERREHSKQQHEKVSSRDKASNEADKASKEAKKHARQAAAQKQERRR